MVPQYQQTGGSTSGLVKHLRIKHSDIIAAPSLASVPATSTVSSQSISKQSTISFKPNASRSMSEMVARLAAVDGISTLYQKVNS